jgi:hypothetical protein
MNNEYGEISATRRVFDVRPRLRLLVAALGILMLILGQHAPASAESEGAGEHVTVGASASGSAALCYSSNCSYRDPVEMGCSADAYTSHEFSLNHIRVEERHSVACDATWSRMTITTPNLDCAAGWVWHEKRYADGALVKTGNSCSWTQMLGKGTGVTRACGWSAAQQACTPFR